MVFSEELAYTYTEYQADFAEPHWLYGIVVFLFHFNVTKDE